jgi:hypothetical protein
MKTNPLELAIKKLLKIKQIPAKLQRNIDEYLRLTSKVELEGGYYARQFLALEDEPTCLLCEVYPRLRLETRFCSLCKNGQPIDKNVDKAFTIYMEKLYPLLFHSAK